MYLFDAQYTEFMVLLRQFSVRQTVTGKAGGHA
jgi:hypothetical protein